MNPFVQFLQMLASGAGAGAAGAPTGLLAGGKAAEAAGAVAQAAPAAAPQGLLGGLQGMIGKERGADLMSMGAAMMQAGGTSTDPRSGDFFSALGTGMGAAQNSQTQRADTNLKNAVSQAQIGSYNSSAAQNTAQADVLRGQADAMKQGMPVYAGAGAAAAAAPTSTPGTVIQPTAPAAPAEQAGPQPGQVYDGFRFKGGSPNDPNSWEKV